MTEVIKIVHNYYDPGALVKKTVTLNINPFGITRGNKFKLQKFTCHYNIRFALELLIFRIAYKIMWWRLIL